MIPATPTLKLGAGGEDEDTFATFVGKFDDEYDDRRGEWTFRACPMVPPFLQSSSGDTRDLGGVRAEWQSPSAGKYEIFGDGQVLSKQSGCIWRLCKTGIREYELAKIMPGVRKPSLTPSFSAQSTPPTEITRVGSHYVLACKSAHMDYGGIKPPSTAQQILHHQEKAIHAPTEASGLRVSISESPGAERTARLVSLDSAVTSKQPAAISAFLAQSLPKSHDFAARLQTAARDVDDTPYENGRRSGSFGAPRSEKQDFSLKDMRIRSRSKERDPDEKKRSIGGVFKRGLMASMKTSGPPSEEKKAIKEEKIREKLQSQSWSPSSNAQRRSYFHPSGKSFKNSEHQAKLFRAPSNPAQSLSTSGERQKPSALLGPLHEEDGRPRHSPDLDVTGYSTPREERAWSLVPDEAVAMVVPIEVDERSVLQERTSPSKFYLEGVRQVLLVWYVPFNSESDDRTLAASMTSSISRDISGSSTNQETETLSSLPKFQKLLRRRVSKDRDTQKRDKPDYQVRTNRINNYFGRLSASSIHYRSDHSVS